ncbi:hypothetical protein Patl1_26790 [Pistacia atlantica]|uniref:Uncharacterized protein n=1 Tax=Pistacia atlantica TaxID=434234 RepID=A0ACC1AYX6_9ROSI|nr:hypothetical protein Patl1_26790 [Pistacia atlantica]
MVKGAKNRPNIERFRKKLGKPFGKFNAKVSSKIKGHTSEDTISGTHVTVPISVATVGRTFMMGKTQNPVWMQHFNAPVAHYVAEVHLVLKESYVVASEIVGAVGIPVEQLCSDAHIQDGCLPNLKLDGGMEFNQASCWQDIYDAISEARHLIYIAGWSLNHTLRLVRNGNNTYSLGDLLKIKSKQGVKICCYLCGMILPLLACWDIIE